MKTSLNFEYKNWKGEVGVRHILPKEMWFGSTEFHLEPQWLLKGFDLGKHEERDFAVRDIIRFL